MQPEQERQRREMGRPGQPREAGGSVGPGSQNSQGGSVGGGASSVNSIAGVTSMSAPLERETTSRVTPPAVQRSTGQAPVYPPLTDAAPGAQGESFIARSQPNPSYSSYPSFTTPPVRRSQAAPLATAQGQPPQASQGQQGQQSQQGLPTQRRTASQFSGKAPNVPVRATQPMRSAAPQPDRLPSDGSGRSLGITELLEPQLSGGSGVNGQMRTDETPVVGRAPTLTEQLRSIRPPDVARQAVSELGVLARELSTLPNVITESGLARVQQSNYLEVVAAYRNLAHDAWEAIAEERLEQSGAEPEYRQRAITIAREATRLRRECHVAASNTQLPLPRRVPFLWRTRTRLIQSGLRGWQADVASPPDPRATGYALFLLRGQISLACGGMFELMTYTLLSRLALILTPIVGVAALLPCIAAFLTGDSLRAASYATGALLIFLLWTLHIFLTSRSRAPLGVLLGSSVFSPEHSPCNGLRGARFSAVLLRAWWILMGVVGLLGGVGALGVGGFALYTVLKRHLLTLSAHTVPQGLTLGGAILALLLGPLTLMVSATLLALAVPTLLVSAWRFAAELGGNLDWIPTARRYALTPAFSILAFLIGALLGVVWVEATALGLHLSFLLIVILGAQPPLNNLIITMRVVPLALTLALPYLAVIEAPYRIGVWRWRRAWLRELETRRAQLESHVRRLSTPDPRTGVQDTSDENRRALEYDMVLLQFYRTKIEEAQRVSPTPLTFWGIAFLALVIIAGALLFDSGAVALGALTLSLP